MKDSFSSRLRLLRLDLKFSQVEFARKLGISPQALLNYENDYVLPKIDLLKKISTTFDVNANWLLTGKGSMKNNFEFDEKILNDERFMNFFYWFNQEPIVQLQALSSFEDLKIKYPGRFDDKNKKKKKEKR